MVKVGTQMTFVVGSNHHVKGTIRYIGPLDEDNSGQDWLGVELVEPVGRHSGRQYFECAERCGLFVKASSVAKMTDTDPPFHPPRRGPLHEQYEAGMLAVTGGSTLTTSPPQPIGVGDVLMVMDMQYDFLPGGSFGVPEGDDVIDSVCGLITAAVTAGSTVICTRDYHPHDHASFRKQGGPFPQHCVQGSRGSRLAAPIAAAVAKARSSHPGQVDIAFKGYHRDVRSRMHCPASNALAPTLATYRRAAHGRTTPLLPPSPRPPVLPLDYRWTRLARSPTASRWLLGGWCSGRQGRARCSGGLVECASLARQSTKTSMPPRMCSLTSRVRCVPAHPLVQTGEGVRPRRENAPPGRLHHPACPRDASTSSLPA